MTVLVGKKAPEFQAAAVIDGAVFKDELRLVDYRGRYVLLFFYPLDFTFVCPTELHAFQEKLELFRQKNCEVLGCSVDSQYSHHAWLQMPKAKGGIQGIQYPLLADMDKSIAKNYGVLLEDAGVALRGAFLIDKEGVIRQQTVNDLPLGRSVDEFLRLLEALQHVEKHGEVCPANWNKGDDAMKPDAEGLKNYFK